jgi:Flp pilus assembly protein TadB
MSTRAFATLLRNPDMIFACLFLLLSVAGSLLYLASLTLRGEREDHFAANDYFQNQGLPETGLERYRLLQENPEGAAMEKVKEAARRKVAIKKTSPRQRLLLINGYQFPDERRSLAGKIALSALLLSSLTLFILLPFTSMTMAVTATALMPPLVVAGSLYLLSRKAAAIELHYLQTISGLLEPLRKALQSGFDLSTTLETLIKQLAFEQDSNPVLIAFQLATDRSKAGYPLTKCLRDVCAETGISQMSQLAGLLSVLEEHGAPWSTAFNELRESVDATLRTEKNRPRMIN